MPPKKKVAPKAKDAGDIIKVFQAFDTNGDKFITSDEMGVIMKKLDSSWTDRKIQLLLKEVDQNHDGKIDYEEFVVWLMSSGKGGDKRQAVRQAAEKALKESGAAGSASSEAAKDAAASSGGGAAGSADSDAGLDAALEELFKFYDLDEDGEIERIELLEAEEQRLGQLEFTQAVRRATIAWFKAAGATGNATDGMFLPKDKWKIAMKAKAAEGAKEAEDAALQNPTAWLHANYGKLWELNAPKPARGGGGGEEEEEDGTVEPPDWLKPGAAPLTVGFKEIARYIDESLKFQKNILICSSGKDQLETFLSYQSQYLLVDGKAIVSRVFGLKNQTMEEAQAEAKSKLEYAMNSHGFCRQIHFRLNNSALDFSRFCFDGFPREVFDRESWTIDEAYKRGFFDGSHKVLLESDGRWKTWNIVITSTFDLEGATDFLKDKIPHYDKMGVLVVDPASID